MDAAEKYKNRHQTVIEYANGAMFNVAELDAWAASNKVPVSFEKLLKDEDIAQNYDADNHYVAYEILSIMLASRLVPADMDPSEASIQLMAAGDVEKHKDPVRRLRDLVMVRYDRQLLSAAYDGDLFLYDTLTMSRIDINAARMRYDAEPEAFLQAAQARLMDAAQGSVKPADIDQAKGTLMQKFARLDHLAWAMVILTADAPPRGEERYRQILSTTRWLQSLGLPFRHGNGLPASQPRGVPVAGMDVREYQYLAVADVRAAAIEARCWPIEERETPSMLPFSYLVSRPVKLLNLPLLTPDWLARDIAFARVKIPDDERLAALKKEVPAGAGMSHIESLTGDDWRLIREICGGNPPAPCSPADFESYRERFEKADNRPVWSLYPEFRYSDAMVKAQNAHNEIYSQHIEQIAQRVRDGKLSLVTPAGIETTILDEGCIRLAGVKAYLDQCCIDWEIVSARTDAAHPALSVSDGTMPGAADNPHRPDWDNVWRHTWKVTLREAVSLSCDTDPKTVALNPLENFVAQVFPLPAAGKEICSKILNRLQIARSHAGLGGTLPTVSGGKDDEVCLATFAEWAVNTMKWTVPDELRALAGNGTALQSVAVPEMTHVPTPLSQVTKVFTAASNADAATALEMGTNSKEAMNAHIETRARAMYVENPSLNKGGIAKAIAEELKRAGHSGERGDYLSAATIEKAVPAGLTGGRAANGKNRKR
jgi:hypothetical protein